uniref:Uncharacterized protein n=1 Tax=Arundo donax TaxID=35708 RepID=A0A0A9ALT8_ARUDO
MGDFLLPPPKFSVQSPDQMLILSLKLMPELVAISPEKNSLRHKILGNLRSLVQFPSCHYKFV